mgnify:CR=1 FL=1|tara:strand:- start:24 stop:386 length:363 start_codon:yes stop_codon:yes gene_type:complete
MSFSHKFPSTVMIAGYLENVKAMQPSKHSGKRCVGTLYNPAVWKNKSKNEPATAQQFDLRVPLIGFGKIAELMVQYSMQGDLVAVVGRLVQLRQGKDQFVTGLYIELLKTLDDEEEYDEH